MRQFAHVCCTTLHTCASTTAVGNLGRHLFTTKIGISCVFGFDNRFMLGETTFFRPLLHYSAAVGRTKGASLCLRLEAPLY